MSSSPPERDDDATLTVPFRGQPIPVTYSGAVTRDQAVQGLASQPFQSWLRRCETGTGNTTKQLCVHAIEIQSIDFFGPRRVGFMKIKTHTTLTDGGGRDDHNNDAVLALHETPLPGICFLRGNAVSIFVALFCEDDGKVYSLLTDQPRVPLGMASVLELPAGMLDSDAHSVSGIAVQEMEEECGITVCDTDFVDLTELACQEAVALGNLPMAALSPSGGGCDEMLRYLYLEKKVTTAELEEMRGRLHGLREHGEYITLEVVPMEDVWKISGDSKAMISLFLVEQLRRDGKLPPAGKLATPLNDPTDTGGNDETRKRTSSAAESAAAAAAATLRLSNGVTIPQLAFGLYQIPSDDTGVDILLHAIKVGYRHFDAATAYGNTATLGEALRRSKIPRREFFLTSKVWNDAVAQGRSSVRSSVEKELSDLNFACQDSNSVYFDVMYIHWPVPGHFIEAYRELELLYNEGKIRGIGMSNFSVKEYSELTESSISIPPLIVQFEVSPIMYRRGLVNYFQERGIVVAASKSLGRASGFESATIKDLSHKYSVTPAQIMVRWAIQKSLVSICKTSRSDRMSENRSIHHFSLDDEDMALLDAMTSEDDIRARNELEATRKTSR